MRWKTLGILCVIFGLLFPYTVQAQSINDLWRGSFQDCSGTPCVQVENASSSGRWTGPQSLNDLFRQAFQTCDDGFGHNVPCLLVTGAGGAGSGTVTSITGGTCISGGTITTSGTLSVTADCIGPTQIDETANYTWSGTNAFTGPLNLPHSTTLPATCSLGQVYMDTDATSGLRLYLCESTNTWVAQGNAGTVSGTGITGRVAFWTGTSSVGSNANFRYDTAKSQFVLGDLPVGVTGDLQSLNPSIAYIGDIGGWGALLNLESAEGGQSPTVQGFTFQGTAASPTDSSVSAVGLTLSGYGLKSGAFQKTGEILVGNTLATSPSISGEVRIRASATNGTMIDSIAFDAVSGTSFVSFYAPSVTTVLVGSDAVIGANQAGLDHTIFGGQGTGTGAGGSILLQTAPAGSTGSSLNALVTRVEITSPGETIVTGPGFISTYTSPSTNALSINQQAVNGSTNSTVRAVLVDGTLATIPQLSFNSDSTPFQGWAFHGTGGTNNLFGANFGIRIAGTSDTGNWGAEIDVNNEKQDFGLGDARGGRGLLLNTGSTYSPDYAIHITRVTGEGTGPGWHQALQIDGARDIGIRVQARSSVGSIKAYQAMLEGDTQPRFNVDQDGSITWGSGSAVGDVLLHRAGAAGALEQYVGTVPANFLLTSENASAFDNISLIDTWGKNGSGGFAQYARMQVQTTSVTASHEYSRMLLAVANDGVLVAPVWIYGTGVSFDSSGVLDASANVQINSTTQGFLTSRMTTTQRDAIGSPAEGLFVWNTTLHKGSVRKASAWGDVHVSGDSTSSDSIVVGTATPTVSSGEVGMTKITASGVAPGAGSAKFEWVAGTNSGTCKLISYAGTSATAVTITDNVGAGC